MTALTTFQILAPANFTRIRLILNAVGLARSLAGAANARFALSECGPHHCHQNANSEIPLAPTCHRP
ncbi:MAG TPA: hypothetical protein DDZ68_10770 [Parvularcula sp.]|nr:hypothetical protein [Parvularcula sp.]HBS33040.1 hypothetical protein [Parvularcula sp.]HBS35703.1 hypothetical protein [Parvularcula sp.]